ncbi:MAG: hypothetical protein ACRDKB_02900 [Actinomycetota bacterium]
MKKVPVFAKAAIGLGLVAGLVAFGLILEFGINAGQIHYGVTVSAVNVGGMTVVEAEEFLRERGNLLQSEEICFERRELSGFCVVPTDLGWYPGWRPTAREAYSVGRDDFPLGAISDRLKAWAKGVNIKWSGRARARLVTALLDELEQELAEDGFELKRGLMRYKIRRAIVTYPRRTFRIPLES